MLEWFEENWRDLNEVAQWVALVSVPVLIAWWQRHEREESSLDARLTIANHLSPIEVRFQPIRSGSRHMLVIVSKTKGLTFGGPELIFEPEGLPYDPTPRSIPLEGDRKIKTVLHRGTTWVSGERIPVVDGKLYAIGTNGKARLEIHWDGKKRVVRNIDIPEPVNRPAS